VGEGTPETALTRTPRREERPELFSAAAERLGLIERINIHLVRRTFTIAPLDRAMLFLARTIGAFWVHECTKNIRHEFGFERLPPNDPEQSFILVSNHRSFFDMFVINMVLYKRGWRHRLLFPVRSNFFYDHPLGFVVNGIMSFWSMYPPIFRDRKKAVLNHTAFNELIWAMKHGRSAGIHPEGTRKKDDDPYTFLPAQSGVGRAIYKAKTLVIPIFVNGLGNDLLKQVAGNFTGRGKPVIVVFGKPIDFGALLAEPPSGRLFKQIADKTLEEIGKLGQEERELRAKLVS
jgi:1-acyl-sn-glycerol-3-phosphate acyltransferase